MNQTVFLHGRDLRIPSIFNQMLPPGTTFSLNQTADKLSLEPNP